MIKVSQLIVFHQAGGCFQGIYSPTKLLLNQHEVTVKWARSFGEPFPTWKCGALGAFCPFCRADKQDSFTRLAAVTLLPVIVLQLSFDNLFIATCQNIFLSDMEMSDSGCQRDKTQALLSQSDGMYSVFVFLKVNQGWLNRVFVVYADIMVGLWC